ncbi:hypothetical protein GCM10011409_31820 [Lentibacillus populi]|uniref:Uncharacterized protein n=1 Tax=Lentibacillus populi TaxID=1827502 RepID=A0A9W5U048_9BACI|nr:MULTISPECIES: hypothetical protein [Bacillaceae]GGB51878.1 hypothetical protein GCM10011409_31820 [Lentibacillus populi]
MDKSKKIIIGIALFVYTLAIIGLTTMIVVPNPNNDVPTRDCDCADEGLSDN